MITEWELECAVVSRFALVLPDLAAQGYQISRQRLIASRRLDIVLERPGDAWIIELKRASPHVADVSAQLLDYKRCWEAARPQMPVRLMVISNSASPEKVRALADKGIEYRPVPLAQILDVLSTGVDIELLGQCSRLAVEDEEKVRFLLSNFAHTKVPEGMQFGHPWTHDGVFYALIRDGRGHKKPWLKNIYVKVFDQKPNCAVLYHSEAEGVRDNAPLHLNPRASSWPADGWLTQRLVDQGAIEYASTDNKSRESDRGNFDHYRVLDWERFAKILSLTPSVV